MFAEIVESGNLEAAWQGVRENQGRAGVDGVTRGWMKSLREVGLDGNEPLGDGINAQSELLKSYRP